MNTTEDDFNMVLMDVKNITANEAMHALGEMAHNYGCPYSEDIYYRVVRDFITQNS